MARAKSSFPGPLAPVNSSGSVLAAARFAIASRSSKSLLREAI
jgi:hypothetical protein